MPEPADTPPAAADLDLSVEEARAAIVRLLQPVSDSQVQALADSQVLPLAAALGRVLAADLVSPIDVPAHDNSAMDGYAFAGRALGTVATELACIGAVFAGRPYAGTVGPGQCVRIMTGAVLPAGCDTVVPQELCRAEGGRVHIEPGALAAGANCRRAGEDLPRGGVALRAGRVLRPADIGLVASLGLAEVAVRPRLRVALFSTGDEILEPGQPLAPGCIYDSNRHSLGAALQALGVELIDLGLVRDDPAALRQALQQACAVADAVLTSGGVSVGDADHTRLLLAELGDVAFWKVAMRPGRPFAFGALHGGGGRPVWLFALPGNPVAALVSYYALAREGLLRLAGALPQPLPSLAVRSAGPIRKRPGRTEFQRGIVERAADGAWQVRLTGDQGAGILRSLSEANALVVLDRQRGPVAPGEAVEVWLLDALG